MAAKSGKENTFEVYVLYKGIGKNFYVPNDAISHYICLLKSMQDGEFYYSELQTDNGDKDGIVQTHFGKYQFLKPPIFYNYMGITTKTKREIEAFVQNNNFIGTDYELFENNCQHYVEALLEFLGTQGISPGSDIHFNPQRYMLIGAIRTKRAEDKNSLDPTYYYDQV